MMTLPERLRAETRAPHEQMEALFALPTTRGEYRRWCGIFLGFLEPLENRAQEMLGADHPFLAGRAKAGWLHEDLLALGRDEREIAALPRCAELPHLESPAQVLGALYVFEGATLGGQLIARHLESRLGFGHGAGYRYFLSYGAQVGRRWQEFRALLTGRPVETHEAVVGAAVETFQRLGTWCRTRRDALSSPMVVFA